MSQPIQRQLGTQPLIRGCGRGWQFRLMAAKWWQRQWPRTNAIYVSTDYGASWTATAAPGWFWNSVASSADGTKLVATALAPYGGIATSTNSGTSWIISSAPDTNWISVASSADGMKLVAVVYAGQIYTSIDSGTTWTVADAPSMNWQSVASSADGSKLVAVARSGQIYTWQAAVPSLNCPTNMTVEFTSETGAPVAFPFGVTNPYPGDAPANFIPPSGNTFPIGTTSVVCSATNIFGQSSQCSFAVTVLGARAVKENLLAEIAALKSTRFGDGILKIVAGSLNQSLAAKLWLDDEHLSLKGGGWFFNTKKELFSGCAF